MCRERQQMFCATLAPRPSSKASWRSSPAPWPSSRPPASEPPRAWRRRTPDRTAVRVAPRSLRGGLQAPRNLVGTNARERIQEIFHRDDARAAWSRMADQAERIAIAVPPFVMRRATAIAAVVVCSPSGVARAIRRLAPAVQCRSTMQRSSAFDQRALAVLSGSGPSATGGPRTLPSASIWVTMTHP